MTALLAVIMAGFYSPALHATTDKSVEQIKSLINDYVVDTVPHNDDETVSVIIKQFDDIQLGYCQGEMIVSFAKEALGSQPNAVVLSCEGTDNRHVYVPIQIQIMTKVLSVNRLISMGDVITENDISYELYDKNRLYEGYFKEKQDVIGLSVSRTISAGSPLTKKNLKQLPAVKRNQTITLAIRKGAIEVEMIGIAKSDGYVDGLIKVLNPTSKKIVDAVVTGKDRAEIIY